MAVFGIPAWLRTPVCHSWRGVCPPCVERPWLFYWSLNSVADRCILGKYIKWRQNICSSLRESRMPWYSMKLNKSLKWKDTTRLSSAHNLSILWLWTLRPVITLCRFFSSPLKHIRATPMFSIPWSHRTREGNPKFSTPVVNSDRTLAALLLFRQHRYIIVRLKPSTQPWNTILHLTSLWFPSICLWNASQYNFKTITWLHMA